MDVKSFITLGPGQSGFNVKKLFPSLLTLHSIIGLF